MTFVLKLLGTFLVHVLDHILYYAFVPRNC